MAGFPDDVPARANAIDLGGGCVVPGFTDAHVHFPTWAITRRELALQDAASAEQVVARVRDAVAGARPGAWVRGFGWAAEDWTPHRAQLDAVAGDVPVALLSRDWHSLWLSSAALARAGGDLEARGGVVERDADGEPTGVLREAAAWRFRDRFSAPSHDELLAATRAALPEAHARGVIAIHDKDGVIGSLEINRALREAGELTMRVWQSLPAARLEDLAALPERREPPGAMLRAGYAKAYMDGTLGSRTARLLDGSGVEVTTRADFEAIVARAAELDVPVAVHAIGDLAVREALDAFAATSELWRPRGLRQRIEHAQCVARADLPRFAALGVTASVQPAMLVSDRDLAEREWAERLDGAYAYASLRRARARLAGGSDAPVEDLSPLDGMRAAALREWRPQERLPAEAALAAWTAAPAWLAGEEHVRGRLAPGMLADLVVLDRDPLAGEEELHDARVVATMSGGRWLHGAP